MCGPHAGRDRIPNDELGVADDLYAALQSFYRAYPDYQRRPLVVTGEVGAGAARLTVWLPACLSVCLPVFLFSARVCGWGLGLGVKEAQQTLWGVLGCSRGPSLLLTESPHHSHHHYPRSPTGK